MKGIIIIIIIIAGRFCDKIQKFSRKVVALHCVVSGLTKQDMSLQYLCVNKLLKIMIDRAHTIAAKLRYNLRYLRIERKFMARKKIILSFTSFILEKVAAKW